MEKIIKSEYDFLMEKFHQQGKLKVFSEKENQEIINELNTGLNDFLMKLPLKMPSLFNHIP
jgi:hypothetical protein